MDSTVIVTLITVLGGMIFYILQKMIDKRYNKAKDVLESNSSTISDMTNILKAAKELNEDYRLKIQEQEKEIQRLKEGKNDA